MSQPTPLVLALDRLIEAADVMHAQALGGHVLATSAREYAQARRAYRQIRKAVSK